MREYVATAGDGIHLRHQAGMAQKSAEFRQRGGEVYLRTDVVAAADGGVEAEETVAAD